MPLHQPSLHPPTSFTSLLFLHQMNSVVLPVPVATFSFLTETSSGLHAKLDAYYK